LRREGRTCSAKPVGTAACFFSAGGPRARPAPGLPCALSFQEGGDVLKNPGERCRGNEGACVTSRSRRCFSRGRDEEQITRAWCFPKR
jgi:hypothetical protein